MVKIVFWTLCMCFALHMTAFADSEKYYCTEKVRGYDKADFIVMESDDVNIRQAPETGRVLKVLSRHTLMRVLDKEGQWYQVNTDGLEGYVYAPFTKSCQQDMLTEEDFALGYAVLNSTFNEDEAENKLGKLKKKTKIKRRYYYEYDGVKIGVDKKKDIISYIEVSTPQIITMRGISTGDASYRVTGQYGSPRSVVYTDDGIIYEYSFEDEKDDLYKFSVYVNKDSIVTKLVLEKED